MNQQRNVIYKQHQDVLNGEDISVTVRNMIVSTITDAVHANTAGDSPAEWNLDTLRTEYLGLLTLPEDFNYSEDELRHLKKEDIVELLCQRANDRYEEKEELFGADTYREIERAVLLQNVDRNWMEHIDAMDDLKGNVGLQSYAQRDPLNVYRMEGADMFDAMVADIRDRTVRMVLSVSPKAEPIRRVQVANPLTEGFEGGPRQSVKKVTVGAKKGEKVGRNDPCPCGSGKKYKKCCGANDGTQGE
jgi:preprotein translocase subunit SecA